MLLILSTTVSKTMHFFTQQLRLGKIRQAVIAYSEKIDINDAKIAKKNDKYILQHRAVAYLSVSLITHILL